MLSCAAASMSVLAQNAPAVQYKILLDQQKTPASAGVFPLLLQ